MARVDHVLDRDRLAEEGRVLVGEGVEALIDGQLGELFVRRAELHAMWRVFISA
ncbi:MAG: hypothetical protein U0531_00300 [Dehalococcoidia bacterium]